VFGFTCMPLCSSFALHAHSGPWVPAGTRPSLRPLFEEGAKCEQSSGEVGREDAKACLQDKV